MPRPRYRFQPSCGLEANILAADLIPGEPYFALDTKRWWWINPTTPLAAPTLMEDIVSGDIAWVIPGVKWTPLDFRVGLTMVKHTNGVWVAVKPMSNRVYFSRDGKTWKLANLPSSHNWDALGAGVGTFILACGDSTFTLTSTDGETWTAGGETNSGELHHEMACDEKSQVFVLVGDNGSVEYSEDLGASWEQLSGTHPSCLDVAYGFGQWIGVSGSAGYMMAEDPTDNDGWTIVATDIGTSIAWGNGRWVTSAGLSSADGVTWDEPTTAPEGVTFDSKISYANGIFAMTVTGGIATTTDGDIWTMRTDDVPGTWCDIAYGDGLLVAVSSDAAHPTILTSGK